jgi:hypothetical protein
VAEARDWRDVDRASQGHTVFRTRTWNMALAAPFKDAAGAKGSRNRCNRTGRDPKASESPDLTVI